MRLIYPVQHVEITQAFGNKLIVDGEEYYRKWGYPGHNGVDFAPEKRGIPGDYVIAAHDGVLTLKEDPGGYGHYATIIDHAGIYKSVYAPSSGFDLVYIQSLISIPQ